MSQASNKITGRYLIWYGHVTKRQEEHPIRELVMTNIPGKRKRPTENKTERRVPTIHETYRTWSGRGHDDPEKEANQPYR